MMTSWYIRWYGTYQEEVSQYTVCIHFPYIRKSKALPTTKIDSLTIKSLVRPCCEKYLSFPAKGSSKWNFESPIGLAWVSCHEFLQVTCDDSSIVVLVCLIYFVTTAGYFYCCCCCCCCCCRIKSWPSSKYGSCSNSRQLGRSAGLRDMHRWIMLRGWAGTDKSFWLALARAASG